MTTFVLLVKGARRPPAPCPLREAVERLVMALLLLSLVVTWHVEWFIVPTGSMADTLVGLHRDVVCSECGRAFACGADEPATRGKLGVCPNCGSTTQELESVPPADGDRLLVHRAAFMVRAPRRWELAAFRDASRASQVVVKRIAGLPGETIEIRSGDVFVDGQIQRKTLPQFRALAILVHDADLQPPPEHGLPNRWQGEAGSTRWEASGGTYIHPATIVVGSRKQVGSRKSEVGQPRRWQPGDTARPTSDFRLPTLDLPIDWLTYRHWRRRPGRPRETQEVAIDDGYGCNQTRPIVDSYAVGDLLLVCKLRTSGAGRLALFATDGRSQFLAYLDPATRRGELFCDSRPAATADELPPLGAGETKMELALCDQQLLLALDGRLVFSHSYTPGDGAFHPTSRPVKIGSQGLLIELSDVKLYRDVYYTPPRRRDQVGQYRLGRDEYFVLGDNSPLSFDSRDWPTGPGVPAESLVGKPFLVHYPSRWLGSSGPGGWGFQVPDLTKIRYIR